MGLPFPYDLVERQVQRVGFCSERNGVPFAPIRPQNPFWVVGDVHGCRDLLDAIILQLTDEPAVFVGDLVDRGPESRAVLERVFDLCTSLPDEFKALKGNHEQVLLDFLKNPDAVGPGWIRMGGLQTLASYDISLGTAPHSKRHYQSACVALKEAMGARLIGWLESLPNVFSNGNVHVVHAGAHPARSMLDQDPNDLIWGHRDFGRLRRADGQWVVHGHVIVKAPIKSDGCIAIDTGAYATGVLTAAYIAPGYVEFVSTDKNKKR